MKIIKRRQFYFIYIFDRYGYLTYIPSVTSAVLRATKNSNYRMIKVRERALEALRFVKMELDK